MQKIKMCVYRVVIAKNLTVIKFLMHNVVMPVSKRRTYSAPYRQLWNLFSYRYFRQYAYIEGDAEAICRETVERCWNGTFYATSFGNFNYFWIRDFAAVAKSLRKLGYIDRVRSTIHWALWHYMEHDAVTLCITPNGRLFDAPKAGIDALPSLMHCIRSARYQLSSEERAFLKKRIDEFVEDYLDPETGMIRAGLEPAELRDGAIYDRSAYAVAMVERLAWACERNDLAFPWRHEMYQQELIDHYWNGQYFNADYSNTAFSAECALVPFIIRAVEDESMLNATLNYIRDHKLAEPYAMKYTDTPKKFRYRLWARTVMRNYAGDTIWTWHGAYYLRLLWGQNRPEAAKNEAAFAGMLERYHTFPEVLQPDGSIYNSLLYNSSEGMIWAAIFLTIEDYKPKLHT